jgi:hypothetical protein
VALTIDRQKDLIEMPFIARLWSTAPQLIGLGLAKFPTPLADGLIGHDDATDKEQLFDIAVTEAEPVIQPDPMADDLPGEAVVLVAVG